MGEERRMKNTEYIEKNFALEKADNKDHLGIFYHDEADIIIKFINSLPTVDVIPVDEWLLNHYEVGNEYQNKIIDELISLYRAERKEECGHQ